MGKALASASKLHQITKMATPSFKNQKTISENRVFKPETSKSGSFVNNNSVNSEKLKLKVESPVKKQNTIPLSEVVSDCVKRWFADTLKEAKAGDVGMQVLVGQMYCSGYGTPKDAQKGKQWITKASRTRSSALKVGDKRPGYNASDSDSESDELKDDATEIK
ncbi:Sel1 repeat protein [Thalictrum thalictroides]|uniref:Sel1 repeat protein n=1 Tax=Thalictrum thalictroides TaxID=46969 RepID=A0A7J6VAW9_THATH|nr:Sel1 repeat protein [Thalictrum thalictroides]